MVGLKRGGGGVAGTPFLWPFPFVCRSGFEIAGHATPTQRLMRRSPDKIWEEVVKRMKLVFFVAADPAKDANRLSAAYHFASAADAAGLNAEVRLADDAVLAADPAYVATVPGGDVLRNRMDTGLNSGVEVSVCPRSAERYGVNNEQIAAIGALPRPLSDILVDVAEGRSVLVHLG